MRPRPIVRGLLVLACMGVSAHSATLADERGKGGEPAPKRQLLGSPQLTGDDSLLPYPREGDADRTSAISQGLAWLATRQSSRDGSIEVGDAEPGQRAPLAVTSLAALAWMSGGSTLTRGEHQENVKRAVEYLLASTHRSSDDFPGFIEDRGDNISRTHGHGLATLALAQAYTVSPYTPLGKRIGETLLIAIERIEDSQGAEGGWFYSAGRSIQHEGSVTVAMVQALRAANDVGIRVDPDVVAEAVGYVTRLQVMELPTDRDPAVEDRRPSGSAPGRPWAASSTAWMTRRPRSPSPPPVSSRSRRAGRTTARGSRRATTTSGGSSSSAPRTAPRRRTPSPTTSAST